MRQTWRWFGPLDKIDLSEIKQAGAEGIVTALHEIPYGEVWPREKIAARKAEIERAGFTWDVVESLPVHEQIKFGTGDLRRLFENYRQSMANLAAEGVTTICYNFMPVLDWTRTTLNAPEANGGTALRFEMAECAAFDLYMMDRESDDYNAEIVATAKAWWADSTEDTRAQLTHSIMSGLPGAYQRYDAKGLRAELDKWHGFTADDLRASLAQFLREILPTANELGLKMCVHPDDPPRPLFGLPRIVSNADDLAFITGVDDSVANGVTLCSGSLGANPKNDVPAIAAQFADRIHFAHLRNVKRDPDGSFQESEHLNGDVDMVALVANLLTEEQRRADTGHADSIIPFRPDHGHALLTDANRDAHPGYPLIGRLRGLAELRGVMAGLSYKGN
ncbi:mannonate dehydratase [Maritalea mediterranea]|uniref:Mannonate dehydratase n=1 Tax=Maritalea mediterranea TaxID=2909667 RepID=A0ABS9E904_9HYPH|nr:mannonate dehydratase [Maritalea mediterranea]MCF4099353.1 mannonate dehydratase [Maritalea mediterranea]